MTAAALGWEALMLALRRARAIEALRESARLKDRP
jgi:hypothetical protein